MNSDPKPETRKILGLRCILGMAETWTFRVEKPYDWAVAFVTEDGFFSTVSDYGNYGHYWPNPGMHILKFLGTREDPDHLLSKISPHRELDSDATNRAIHDEILRMRREKDIDSDTARAMWSNIEHDDYGEMTLDEFDREYGSLFPDYRLPRVFRHNIQARQFVEIIWPQLQKQFLRKLDELTA